MKQFDPKLFLSTDTMDYVKDFADKFGIYTSNNPYIPDFATAQLRLDLLQEELDEVKAAIYSRDLVNLLKELTDLQYVLDGAYLAFGLDRYKILAMREVHKSNLTKLGPGGKVIKDDRGKIQKPKGYRKPDLSQLFSV